MEIFPGEGERDKLSFNQVIVGVGTPVLLQVIRTLLPAVPFMGTMRLLNIGRTKVINSIT